MRLQHHSHSEASRQKRLSAARSSGILAVMLFGSVVPMACHAQAAPTPQAGAGQQAAPITLPDDPKDRGAVMNRAIDSGNVDTVKQLLKQDPTLANQPGRAGHVPLNSALIDRNKEIVAILLDAGADVKHATASGSPAIFAAVNSGQSDLVTMILDKGADVNAVDASGTPVIFAAIQSGQIDVLKTLVDRGAKLNVTDANGNTPAMAALNSGSFQSGEIARYLQSKSGGGTAQPVDLDVVIAMVRTGQNSSQLLPDLLKNVKDVNALGNSGMALLHAAAENGSVDSARILLDSGARVDVRSSNGETPLLIAAEAGDQKMVEFLLNSKADPNARDNSGNTCLSALLKGDAVRQPMPMMRFQLRGGDSVRSNSIAQVLIDHGARADVPDLYDITALQYAILNRNKFALAILPKSSPSRFTTLLLAVSGDNAASVAAILKANPELARARLATGTTALHVAALWGAVHAASVLIKVGADIDMRDASARTPLILASSQPGNTAMVGFLLSHHANVNARDSEDMTPLHYAVKADDLAVVKALLTGKADLDARSRRVGPPLSYVGDTASNDVAAALLAAGANPNASNEGQQSPLISAIRANNTTLVKLLIAKGANVNMHSSGGGRWNGGDDTQPLLIAISQRQPEIARLLIDAGANVQVGQWGQSALTMATNSGQSDIADLIKTKIAAQTAAK
jgi:ankyrin repeat protein